MKVTSKFLENGRVQNCLKRGKKKENETWREGVRDSLEGC